MGNKGYKIVCGKCGSTGPYIRIENFAHKMDAQEKVKEAWNRRAKDDDWHHRGLGRAVEIVKRGGVNAKTDS